MIGTYDLMMGLVLVTVLFGAKRLPELAKSLGTSMKEFRKGMAEVEGKADHETSPAAPAATAVAEPTAVATAARTCASCQGPLQGDWKHCPRCGAAV